MYSKNKTHRSHRSTPHKNDPDKVKNKSSFGSSTKTSTTSNRRKETSTVVANDRVHEPLSVILRQRPQYPVKSIDQIDLAIKPENVVLRRRPDEGVKPIFERSGIRVNEINDPETSSSDTLKNSNNATRRSSHYRNHNQTPASSSSSLSSDSSSSPSYRRNSKREPAQQKSHKSNDRLRCDKLKRHRNDQDINQYNRRRCERSPESGIPHPIFSAKNRRRTIPENALNNKIPYFTDEKRETERLQRLREYYANRFRSHRSLTSNQRRSRSRSRSREKRNNESQPYPFMLPYGYPQLQAQGQVFMAPPPMMGGAPPIGPPRLFEPPGMPGPSGFMPRPHYNASRVFNNNFRLPNIPMPPIFRHRLSFRSRFPRNN